MCGRIVQYSPFYEYVEKIGWRPHQLFEDTVGPRYNIPPGTHPAVLHRLGGEYSITRLFWGYKPPWLKRSPVSNARLDTIDDPGKNFWRGPFEHGRVVVPAEGWYEWTGEKGDKQPWFIHGAHDAPLFFAAITAWRRGAEIDAAHGMAIVTDDAAGGLIDIHDRRPVALTPELASIWADPETSLADARAILSAALPEAAFEWHPVRREVGNSRYERPDAIDPV